jgi:hypothetical protein
LAWGFIARVFFSFEGVGKLGAWMGKLGAWMGKLGANKKLDRIKKLENKEGRR